MPSRINWGVIWVRNLCDNPCGYIDVVEMVKPSIRLGAKRYLKMVTNAKSLEIEAMKLARKLKLNRLF